MFLPGCLAYALNPCRPCALNANYANLPYLHYSNKLCNALLDLFNGRTCGMHLLCEMSFIASCRGMNSFCGTLIACCLNFNIGRF